MKLHAYNPECHHAFRRLLRSGALVLIGMLLLTLFSRQSGAQDAASQIRWKSIEMAQVRLDDKAPLKWNVYQSDKKGSKDKKRDASLVLVLLGHRYLMIDTKARLVYLVPLAELHAS